MEDIEKKPQNNGHHNHEQVRKPVMQGKDISTPHIHRTQWGLRLNECRYLNAYLLKVYEVKMDFLLVCLPRICVLMPTYAHLLK